MRLTNSDEKRWRASALHNLADMPATTKNDWSVNNNYNMIFQAEFAPVPEPQAKILLLPFAAFGLVCLNSASWAIRSSKFKLPPRTAQP